MSGWAWLVTLNLIVSVCYVLIAANILRGLVHTHQLRSNRLALATAAIFATCAAGHGGHALHLLFGLDPATRDAVRDAFGVWYLATFDLLTAIVAVIYLGLRRSYGRLLRSPAMFDIASELRYRQLAANLPHTTVYLFDTDLRILLAEGEYLAGSGRPTSAVEGRLLSEILPSTVDLDLDPYWQAALDNRPLDFDYSSAQTGLTYRVRSRPAYDESGTVVGGLLFAENVTEDRAVRARLTEALNFNDAVLAASPDITTINDARTGAITWSSRSIHEMLDWTTHQTRAGGPPDLDSLLVDEDRPRIAAATVAVRDLNDGGSLTVRYRLRGGDGTTRWVSQRTTPFLRGPDGAVAQTLSVVREVTDAMTAEQELQHAALHDPLTGLPNRSLLVDRIASAIARADREDTEIAVLFCDLDGFKRINDTAGHAAGDVVLIEVADRLRQALRRSDSIARVGGDEFVIIIEPGHAGRNAVPQPRHADETMSAEDEHSALSARQVAQLIVGRIRAALAQPVVCDGRAHHVSISIGMTFARSGSAADDVLRDADAAMYLAKQRGRDRFEIFDDTLRAEVAERNDVEQALRSALSDDSRVGGAALDVAYQPVFDLTGGDLVGFEALARLNGPDGSAILPDRFIPVAEHTGLITQLGAQVLEMALAGLVNWRARHPDAVPATLAVNFSARQAYQSDLVRLVLTALDTHHLRPQDLVLELTESILLDAGSSGMRQLKELHRAGVGIAIDDFGTGYASLSYLATLPITSLKVDKSFTAGLPSDPTSSTIVRAIAALAAELGLTCVVEGIETEEQLAALPSGVLGQGYLLGRPAPLLPGAGSRIAIGSRGGADDRRSGPLLDGSDQW